MEENARLNTDPRCSRGSSSSRPPPVSSPSRKRLPTCAISRLQKDMSIRSSFTHTFADPTGERDGFLAIVLFITLSSIQTFCRVRFTFSHSSNQELLRSTVLPLNRSATSPFLSFFQSTILPINRSSTQSFFISTTFHA